MAKFTVDTHLFRELGDLLVGRDSTALVELIKNAYDADATSVLVYGEALEDRERGVIRVSDDGVGMSMPEFEHGFLRIASRTKEQGSRVSKRFKRRYTGAKGIGRLAAHKLARVLEIESIAWEPNLVSPLRQAVAAKIDWDLVEKQETLDDLEKTEAIIVGSRRVTGDMRSGTTITLRRLRRRWSPEERGRFLAEVQSFEPPPVLVSPLPEGVVNIPLLFKELKIRDTTHSDPGFHIQLEGEFDTGEDYWQTLAQAASWIIEIAARREQRKVSYTIAPTCKTLENYPWAERRTFSIDHPDHQSGPFFQGRILVREGPPIGSRAAKHWARAASGIRVFMEGFRVLPYGEAKDDWLSLDSDYARRARALPWLEDEDFPEESEDRDAPLVHLPNRSYFGAICLTQADAPSLRLLVNREGFVPDSGFNHLVELVRKGIDLATRVRASVKSGQRNQRREQRSQHRSETGTTAARSTSTGRAVGVSISRATSFANEARQLVLEGDLAGATEKISNVVAELEETDRVSEELISESSMLRVLASVGTQMAAFIHEINALLGMTQAIDNALSRLRDDPSLPKLMRTDLAKLHSAIGDLRRHLERQASYLIDVVTPDARRRRFRQNLAERFDAARRLIEYQAARRSIEIHNEIPPDMKSPPMFPAELTTIFSNLLTNAVKAAGEHGEIRAFADQLEGGKICIVIENTGVAVDPESGERWFKPFESTTVTVDPVLGQGMGLGLPITRSMLEEYGAEIRFTQPSKGYATAVEIILPK